MRSDPCRRATFGVTIENTNARFWYTCRAATLVSEEFDIIKVRASDITNLGHSYLSLTAGTRAGLLFLFTCVCESPRLRVGPDSTESTD